MKYAQLKNNVVDLVIESEIDPDGINGNWVACGNAGPGWTYNGSTFTAPVNIVKRYISVGAFFDRFGVQKYPILASADVSVQALIKDCSVRQYIDLDNPQLPYGLAMIVSAGYPINPEAIVSGEIQAIERPEYNARTGV